MASRKTPGTQGEYWSSAYEWAGELQHTHGCSVRVSLLPTGRRGVWRVVVAAVAVADGRVVDVRAKLEGEWPSSQRQTLDGLVFGLVIQLDKAIEATALGGQ